MNEFTISGANDFIKIGLMDVYGYPDSTCFKGGYDALASVEIKSGGIKCKATVYTSTGEIYQLYQSLKQWHTTLGGTAKYSTYENGISLSITSADNMGHVLIMGTLTGLSENKFEFSFETDQSYINTTIRELEAIAHEYGDMSGVK